MAHKPTPKSKDHDKDEPRKPEAQHAEQSRPATEQTRQRTQPVGGAPAQPGSAGARPAQPQRTPMARPVFGRRPQTDPQISSEARQVINALQQTVRSQAVLIRNYQELLRLGGNDQAESAADQNGQDGQDQAA